MQGFNPVAGKTVAFFSKPSLVAVTTARPGF